MSLKEKIRIKIKDYFDEDKRWKRSEDELARVNNARLKAEGLAKIQKDIRAEKTKLAKARGEGSGGFGEMFKSAAKNYQHNTSRRSKNDDIFGGFGMGGSKKKKGKGKDPFSGYSVI